MTSAAYVMGHITVKDPAKWDAYRSQVPATLAPWGAEIMLRGHSGTTLGAGDFAYSDVVVIRFADSSAAQEWFDSPAYQALLPLRAQAAEVVLRVYASL